MEQFAVSLKLGKLKVTRKLLTGCQYNKYPFRNSCLSGEGSGIKVCLYDYFDWKSLFSTTGGLPWHFHLY